MVIHKRNEQERIPIAKMDTRIELDLKDEIGAGTFGKIYRTFYDGKACAVKKFTYSNEPLHLTTLREIKALRTVKSEYVLRIKEILICKYEMFLIFPLYDTDLYRMIGNEKFTLSDIKNIFSQILKGVQAIHNSGYLHRDLKTANILINREERTYNACICDFGMSRTRNPEMTPNMVTLWYRPPEILLGSTKYTKSSDVWSLGCILLEFFNKKPIFKANNEIDALDMIVDLCGSINEEVYPGCSRLLYFDKYKLRQDRKRCVYEKFYRMSPDGADLANRMLEVDPDKRITIEECLKHDFVTRSEY